MQAAQEMYKTRTTCRLCDAPHPQKILPMPSCPPVDNYRFANEPEINLPGFPMDLYLCRACGHAQLLDVVDPHILFGNYIYTSGSSPDLDAHFTQYAAAVVGLKKLKADSLVIDVGSNDGLFLSKFKARGIPVLGIDASAAVGTIANEKGIPTVVSFLDQTTAAAVTGKHGKADVVTANNVFSHSDDLRGFLRSIIKLMKDDGIFVFEVSYLGDLVANRVVDYIYHEHLAHHSVVPLQSFLEREGLTLFDVVRVPTKGGSLRCFAQFKGGPFPVSGVVAAMADEEKRQGLYEPATYAKLSAEFADLGVKTRELFKKVKADGGSIASYGASATTTVLNEMLEINPFVSFIVDDNPSRQERLSPGHRIPVKSSQYLRENCPTYTFVSAWRFSDMIVSRNTEYLKKGGTFVVPLPTFKIIRASDI